MENIELQDDKKYVYADMTIETTTDDDFCPVLKISTVDGKIIVFPSQQDEVIVKSTVDK